MGITSLKCDHHRSCPFPVFHFPPKTTVLHYHLHWFLQNFLRAWSFYIYVEEEKLSLPTSRVWGTTVSLCARRFYTPTVTPTGTAGSTATANKRLYLNLRLKVKITCAKRHSLHWQVEKITCILPVLQDVIPSEKLSSGKWIAKSMSNTEKFPFECRHVILWNVKACEAKDPFLHNG